MGLFSRKPKSSDWKSGGYTPNGLPMSYDKNGNVRTFSPNGEVITYNNRGVVINKTSPGPGSSDDRSPTVANASPSPPKIDQIKTDVQQQTSSQISYSPSTPANGTTSGASNASASSTPESAKPKVEFKTAANGDLLQRAEGGNWYVAKDNPDPVNNVTSPSEGMNKKYGLGEYASPTANDALAVRSEAMNKREHLGEYTPDKKTTEPQWKTALDARSEEMNKREQLGDYAPKETPSAPAWHTNPDWKTVDINQASAAGLDPGKVLEQREGNNGNTIFRMSDGTYQAYNPETGLHNAGTWDNSQWAGSEYSTNTNPPPANVEAASSTGGSPVPEVYSAGSEETNLTKQWVAEHRDEPAPSPSPSATTYHSVSAETSAPPPVPTAQELISGFDYNGPSATAPSASAATYSTPVPAPQTPVSSYTPEVEETNLTRQWVAQHRDEPAAAPSPQPVNYSEPAAVTAAPSYSPADQYSGHVDMAEIERSVAEYTRSQTPEITLPGQSDTDPASVAGLDTSTGGDYLNPGRLAGHGRHYAE